MIWEAVGGFIIGAVLGSFAKATAGRVLNRETIFGRSYCPHCKGKVRWYDLLPVFSYLFLRGRCRNCKKKIPLSDFLAEIGLGIVVAVLFSVTLGIYWNPLLAFNLNSIPIALDFIFKLFILTVLTIVFFTDLESGLILDRITYPAVIITAVYWVVSLSLKSWLLYYSLTLTDVGRYLLPPYTNYLYDHLKLIWQPGILAMTVASAVSLVFVTLIIITRGRGMGWGDVKYAFFLGLAIGFPDVLAGLFFAFLLGSLYSLLLIFLRKKKFGQTIPFGPFLSLGSALALLFGSRAISFYLNTIHP